MDDGCFTACFPLAWCYRSHKQLILTSSQICRLCEMNNVLEAYVNIKGVTVCYYKYT